MSQGSRLSPTRFIKIIKGEGIGSYLQPAQPLLDSSSNPSHIQTMLMHMNGEKEGMKKKTCIS